MMVRDEKDVVSDALESISLLVDEMIVVDTGSTDDTLSIARAHGANVFRVDWGGNLAVARNAAMRSLTGRQFFSSRIARPPIDTVSARHFPGGAGWPHAVRNRDALFPGSTEGTHAHAPHTHCR